MTLSQQLEKGKIYCLQTLFPKRQNTRWLRQKVITFHWNENTHRHALIQNMILFLTRYPFLLSLNTHSSVILTPKLFADYFLCMENIGDFAIWISVFMCLKLL